MVADSEHLFGLLVGHEVGEIDQKAMNKAENDLVAVQRDEKPLLDRITVIKEGASLHLQQQGPRDRLAAAS